MEKKVNDRRKSKTREKKIGEKDQKKQIAFNLLLLTVWDYWVGYYWNCEVLTLTFTLSHFSFSLTFISLSFSFSLFTFTFTRSTFSLSLFTPYCTFMPLLSRTLTLITLMHAPAHFILSLPHPQPHSLPVPYPLLFGLFFPSYPFPPFYPAAIQ